MLVDAGDPPAPSFAVGDGWRRFAMEADFPAVRLAKAGQDSDERRLAGAVAPDQRMRLAGQDAQARVAERDRRAIALRDARSFDNRDGGGRPGLAVWRLEHRGTLSVLFCSYFGLLPQNDLSSTFALVTNCAGS